MFNFLARHASGAALLTALALSAPAHAFKIDTHIWIGQQVINDLEDDGSITVKLRGQPVTVAVPAEVRAAILGNRQAFLLGNIGPDSFPDVVVGQTVVHPGLVDGWKTNDWLNFLMAQSKGNAVGTAFTYGYLGHAAADVFAHTYVNQYAGDIFDLSDETLVEQRHVALESFIGRRNPPLLNAAGQSLGTPYSYMKPNQSVSTFVRDVLIFHPEVAAQYRKLPYARHLPAYLAYRNAIDAAAASDIWKTVDVVVLKLVAQYNNISLTSQEASEVVDFVNEKVIPALARREDLDQATFSKLNYYITRFDNKQFALLNASLREVWNLESRIFELHVRLADERRKLCTRIAGVSCPPKLLDPVCREVTEKIVCPLDNELTGLALSLYQELNNLRSQVYNSAVRLREQAEQTKYSLLELLQALKDTQQALSANTSPIKAYLSAWRTNLDDAMAAYVSAANESLLNTMHPAPSALGPYGAFTPMSNWFQCYHLSLSGVNANCAFYKAVVKSLDDLKNLERILSEVTSVATYLGDTVGLPTPQQVHEEIERLKARAVSELTAAAINAVEDLLPPPIRDLVAVLGAKVDEPELRHYFTVPSSGKQLAMIPDIDTRVKAEMHLNLATNTYDPNQYAVIYNAVTLAKLALLDGTGLAQLALAAGVPQGSNGAALFTGTPNVVANAFASIDGNHQWLTVAPPRAAAMPPYTAVAMPGYPVPTGYASAAGFVPWRPEARNALFRSLFIGPLSPGLESPTEFGLRDVLRADYPYQPCKVRPYPDGMNDKTCIAVKLIPTLMELTD